VCSSEQMERSDAFDWSANRRQFTLAAMGAMAACTTAAIAAGTDPVAEDWVRISTPDGTMDAFFARPAKGAHPAIVTWPDIMGAREAYLLMARRMAGQGYAVLVLNHYYRSAPAPQFRTGAEFVAQGGFQKIGPWLKLLTADAIMRDAKAAVGWLDQRREVDRSRGVGTHGYCLGGAHVVWTAAAVPERVRAVASLHGWALVKSDDAKSPHKLFGQTKARYLFAIGQNDDQKTPEEKTVLRTAAAAAGRPAEVEFHPAAHGWMLPDSEVYDAIQAERAWKRMSALFATL
jgi:carboxymethylenebutenolidase